MFVMVVLLMAARIMETTMSELPLMMNLCSREEERSFLGWVYAICDRLGKQRIRCEGSRNKHL
jgi:hypothetical protein